MLKLNLLPENERRTTLSPIEQFHRTPLMWITVGLMVSYTVLLIVTLRLQRARLQTINSKVRLLEPKKEHLDKIQLLVKELQGKRDALQKLAMGEGMWSKRLNVLSNVTPDGVWFTELNLDMVKGLTIQGSAIAQGGSEMVNVDRVVQDLKADADFAKAVKNIQIESIKRIPESGIELVQFTLSCALQGDIKP